MTAEESDLAAEAEPVFLRKFSLSDGDEAAEARFGSEKIVEAGVEAMLGDVVADGKEAAMRGRVVEEFVFLMLGVEIACSQVASSLKLACRCSEARSAPRTIASRRRLNQSRAGSGVVLVWPASAWSMAGRRVSSSLANSLNVTTASRLPSKSPTLPNCMIWPVLPWRQITSEGGARSTQGARNMSSASKRRHWSARASSQLVVSAFFAAVGVNAESPGWR